MQCERCRRQRAAGAIYSFYYGSKGATETTFEVGARVKRTSYRIAGREGAWICDRCVNMLYIPLVLFAAFALLLFLVASLFPEANVLNAVCFGAVGVALLIGALRSRGDLGEWLALRAKREFFKSQGYDAFFTSLGYKRLKGQ